MGKVQILPILGKAYTCTETRTGPPLSYVTEKMRRCLEGLHSLNDKLHHETEAHVELLRLFRNALTSFLALHNQLGLIDEKRIVKQLLNMRKREFLGWFDAVEDKAALKEPPIRMLE